MSEPDIIWLLKMRQPAWSNRDSFKKAERNLILSKCGANARENSVYSAS
jgi:hypothetical protein